MFCGNCVVFINKNKGRERWWYKINWMKADAEIYLVTIPAFANGGNYVEKLFEVSFYSNLK